MLLQFDFLGNKRIFQFFEFVNVQRAIGKAVVEAVNLGFKRSEFGFEAVNFCLLLVGHFRFPCFDPCQEFFPPFVGNGDELRVAFHFLHESFFADKAAVFASLRPALFRASVIPEAKAALFDMPFGGDGIAMIGFPIEMRENLVENFPIYAPVEYPPAKVCKELHNAPSVGS